MVESAFCSQSTFDNRGRPGIAVQRRERAELSVLLVIVVPSLVYTQVYEAAHGGVSRLTMRHSGFIGNHLQFGATRMVPAGGCCG